MPMTPLAHEMTYENVSSLRDTDTEQIDKHDHVVAVGTCRQCLVADLVDEIGDDHLREAVADILAHGRYANLQQVPQFLPGDGNEVVKREATDMNTEVDDSKQQHGDSAAGCCGNGGTFDTQLRTSPVTEDKSIVSQDVQYVDNARNCHRPNHLVGTSQ